MHIVNSVLPATALELPIWASVTLKVDRCGIQNARGPRLEK
jgi:hypothetical protein